MFVLFESLLGALGAILKVLGTIWDLFGSLWGLLGDLWASVGLFVDPCGALGTHFGAPRVSLAAT